MQKVTGKSRHMFSIRNTIQMCGKKNQLSSKFKYHHKTRWYTYKYAGDTSGYHFMADDQVNEDSQLRQVIRTWEEWPSFQHRRNMWIPKLMNS